MSDQLAKQLNVGPPLTHDEFVAACIALADGHMIKNTWRDYDEFKYLAGITEELGELAEALFGNHEDSPQLELMQIIACAINMHRKFFASVVE